MVEQAATVMPCRIRQASTCTNGQLPHGVTKHIVEGDIPAVSSGATPVPSRVTDEVQVGVQIPQQLCCGCRHDFKAGKDALIWQHITCTSSQCTGLQQPCTRGRTHYQHLGQQQYRSSTQLWFPLSSLTFPPMFVFPLRQHS